MLDGDATVMVVPTSANTTAAPPLLVTASAAPPDEMPSVTFLARSTLPDSAGSASEMVGRWPPVIETGLTAMAVEVSTGVPTTASVQCAAAVPPRRHCG